MGHHLGHPDTVSHSIRCCEAYQQGSGLFWPAGFCSSIIVWHPNCTWTFALYMSLLRPREPALLRDSGPLGYRRSSTCWSSRKGGHAPPPSHGAVSRNWRGPSSWAWEGQFQFPNVATKAPAEETCPGDECPGMEPAMRCEYHDVFVHQTLLKLKIISCNANILFKTKQTMLYTFWLEPESHHHWWSVRFNTSSTVPALCQPFSSWTNGAEDGHCSLVLP
jgi:hypothetical protein